MYVYDKLFTEYNHTVAQMLLTGEDLENSGRRVNFQNTLYRLLELGALPIINENDTIATEEIAVGDNDTLAAIVAKCASAELLVLLSDIDGLFTSDPRKDPDARLIPLVEALTPEIYALAGEKGRRFGPKEALPLEGDRIISNLPFFAYLKIAEGCDNRCTYCAIPMIRGRYRSREMDNIVAEAKRLAAHGVTELNVVAQDTTRYGMDLYGKPMLPELLHRLAQIENLRWIRVLYTYPDWITDELLEVMAEEDKIVKYLDIPLQHCDQKVLREMNRRGDRQSITALIEKIREKVPGIVLRTTLITGFPGETEEQFESLCQFVQDIKFERLGCFAYSAEEGTPAGERADQVEPEVRQRRADIIMELQMGIMEEYNRKLTGTDLEVVVEGYDRYASSYFGRSAADAPDIDGKIFFTSKKKLAVGQYLPVHVDDVLDYDLIGSAL